MLRIRHLIGVCMNVNRAGFDESTKPNRVGDAVKNLLFNPFNWMVARVALLRLEYVFVHLLNYILV